MDAEIQELVKTLLESEHRLTLRMAGPLDSENRPASHMQTLAKTNEHDDAITSLARAAGKFIASADAYVKASHERMTFVEKQLDALVRAITAKPANGKPE